MNVSIPNTKPLQIIYTGNTEDAVWELANTHDAIAITQVWGQYVPSGDEVEIPDDLSYDDCQVLFIVDRYTTFYSCHDVGPALVWNVTYDTLVSLSTCFELRDEKAPKPTLEAKLKACNPEGRQTCVIWVTNDNLGFDIAALHATYYVCGNYFINGVPDNDNANLPLRSYVEQAGIDPEKCLVVFVVDHMTFAWGDERDDPEPAMVVTDLRENVNLLSQESRYHF